MKRFARIYRISFVVFVLGIVGLVGFAGAGKTGAISSTAEFTLDNSETVLELIVPSLARVYLNPTTGRATASTVLNIGVGTNNITGYTLSMTASSASLTRTSSITDGDSNTSTPAILPMTTTGSASGYTYSQFENSSSDSDTLNRWGYMAYPSMYFKPMTTSTIQVATTSGPSNATDPVHSPGPYDARVGFAVKVDATQPAGHYSTTINFTAVTNYVPIVCNPSGTTISSIVCMQDITDTNKSSILSSMTTGSQYQLYDSRDEKQYYVAKLADGNIWMTQNLDHDIVSTANFYTYYNTDIGHGSTPNTSATWTGTATYATSDTTWNYSTSSPESYDPGNLCWNGNLNTNWSGNLSNATTACIDGSNMNYHIGNYYNWTAAVAMTNSGSYTANNTDVEQSICPAGWMLPRSGTAEFGSGTFEYLVNQLSLTSGTSGNIQNTPVFFTYGGNWEGGSYGGVGSSGDYWSSVVEDSDGSYDLYFNVNGALSPQGGGVRFYGYSVRCVAR